MPILPSIQLETPRVYSHIIKQHLCNSTHDFTTPTTTQEDDTFPTLVRSRVFPRNGCHPTLKGWDFVRSQIWSNLEFK